MQWSDRTLKRQTVFGFLVRNPLEIAAASMLVLICGCVFLNVFCRYFLDIGLGWTEEAARYLQIWIMFTGAAIGVKRASHFRLSLLGPAGNGLQRRSLHMFANAAVAVFSGAVCYQGAQLVAATWGQVSPMMGWRIGAVYLVVPFSGLLMCLYAVRNMLTEPSAAQRHSADLTGSEAT